MLQSPSLLCTIIRWPQITNMVTFRNVAHGQGISNWWDNGFNQIAFSRGDRAFIAINNEGYGIDVTLTTGLSEGTYCDVFSGNKENGRCTGTNVYVDGSSRARIILHSGEDAVIAIHTGEFSCIPSNCETCLNIQQMHLCRICETWFYIFEQHILNYVHVNNSIQITNFILYPCIKPYAFFKMYLIYFLF